MTQRYTLKDFWNFMTHGKTFPFEVRFKNFDFVKNFSQKFSIPHYKSSLYVSSYNDLYKLVFYARKLKQTAWISVNPKRKIQLPNFRYPVFTGKDEGIDYVMNIMIDLDNISRKDDVIEVIKNKPKMKEFAYILLDDLKKIGVESYMLIDSGGGYQIVIPIEPLYIPKPELDESNILISPESFYKYKELVKSTFGQMILRKYGNQEVKQNYRVDLDGSSFNIGRVMALHGTYNNKYESSEPVVRKVIDVHNEKENEENKGLLQAMLDNYKDLPSERKNTTSKNFNSSGVYGEMRNYGQDSIYNSALVKFLLSRKLPEGGRHSYLIFPLKVLIMQSGISFNTASILMLKKRIEKVQKKTFPFNEPPPMSIFSINTVNRYCMSHALPLVYDPLPEWNIDLDSLKYIEEYGKRIFSYESYKRWRHTIHNDSDKSYQYDTDEFDERDIHQHLIFMRKLFKRLFKSGSVFDVKFEIYKYLYLMEKKYSRAICKSVIEIYLPRYIQK